MSTFRDLNTMLHMCRVQDSTCETPVSFISSDYAYTSPANISSQEFMRTPTARALRRDAPSRVVPREGYGSHIRATTFG